MLGKRYRLPHTAESIFYAQTKNWRLLYIEELTCLINEQNNKWNVDVETNLHLHTMTLKIYVYLIKTFA